MQGVRELGTLSPKWQVFINSFTSELRKLFRREGRKSQWGWRTPRTPDLNTAKTDTPMSTQTVASCTGMHRDAQGCTEMHRDAQGYTELHMGCTRMHRDAYGIQQ